jgi:hypothetical protein
MKWTIAWAAALLLTAFPTSSPGQTAAISLAISNSIYGLQVPAANSIHGWEFTPTVVITVSHLGLWDHQPPGLGLPHPIGLFRASDGAMLTSGTFQAGQGGTLIDSFRYIDTPDAALTAGTSYVISYHTASDYGNVDDFGSLDDSIGEGSFVAHPVIQYTTARWGYGPLGVPPNTTPSLRFGPNFLFEIPEPATARGAVLALCAMAARRRRQNR